MAQGKYNSFDYPWRLEGKASPFTKRFIVGYCKTLQDAITNAPKLKKKHGYYVVAIRPN